MKFLKRGWILYVKGWVICTDKLLNSSIIGKRGNTDGSSGLYIERKKSIMIPDQQLANRTGRRIYTYKEYGPYKSSWIWEIELLSKL